MSFFVGASLTGVALYLALRTFRKDAAAAPVPVAAATQKRRILWQGTRRTGT
jgi:hypothetical protein